MELHEPEIKPQPLRIIKHSQTVTGRSSDSGRSGGTDEWGMFESSFDIGSEGSPPVATDRPLGPLTVHKIRRGRGSILDGSLSVRIVDIEKKTSSEPRIEGHDCKFHHLKKEHTLNLD
jgi:hypothetical protein